jgi:C_GCAxxG_C_C family probable redox protein
LEGRTLNREEKARQMFEAHENCAQSVLSAFADDFGLDVNTALRIATPFGAGIGRSGHMCGAISGAIMAIGLARGITVYDKAQKDAVYALAQEFLDRFAAKHDSLSCPGLLGFDIGDPVQLEQARELNLFDTRCPEFVGDAVRITEALLGLEP